MDRKETGTPTRIIVQKYGGSSLADLDSIRRVASRVVSSAREGAQIVVVVSAMGNTTNELLALAHGISDTPATRELDMLVSVGERVSMALLAMAIEDLGHPAVSFTGSQSGIITDQHHVAAQVLEVRPTRIKEALSEGRVVVVAGFQGVSTAREVTTLGRGGSDTTAVVLAAALEAEYCEICSDVDGIYSADPRRVSEARRLDEITLDSALAMGRAGAKVLLAEAVERARELGVKLHASATRDRPGSGTVLVPGEVDDHAVAIACDAELELVEIGAADSLDILAGSLRWSWSDADKTMAVVDLRNLHDLDGGLSRLSGVVSHGLVARVSVIGKDMVVDPSRTRSALQALESDWIIAWVATGDGLSILTSREHADECQRRLHRRLIV
jgi:aspartate kinase